MVLAFHFFVQLTLAIPLETIFSQAWAISA